MQPKPQPDYLAGYPANLTGQIQRLIEKDQLAGLLLEKYPAAHEIRTDRALYDYVQQTKDRHLRNTPQPNKVFYDSKLQIINNALGIHARVSRLQGAKLKTHREIRIATLFRDMPPQFLHMIVVHELAHLKESQHNRAFYQLCQHMEVDYHQLEFDLRAYLTYLDADGQPLWPANNTSK